MEEHRPSAGIKMFGFRKLALVMLAPIAKSSRQLPPKAAELAA
jgi:hypothetical protein